MVEQLTRYTRCVAVYTKIDSAPLAWLKSHWDGNSSAAGTNNPGLFPRATAVWRRLIEGGVREPNLVWLWALSQDARDALNVWLHIALQERARTSLARHA